ncbi:AbrB/MazE/SpoVT family DNA-binding domain-containing protein [Methylomagnum sp.]
MHTAIVTAQGQVAIPADIRHQLGIAPGSQLDFTLDGDSIRVEVRRRVEPARPEDGYGMLVCDKPGPRRLSDFDVAQAMREAADDRD